MTASGGTRASVCVIIPTHNRPRLLRAAVDSVRAQGVEGVAIVVVDDGSEPPAREALDDNDPTVHVVRNETPRGPAAARNQGADALDSEYVAFLDDDDQWLPGKLAVCLAAFDRYPEAGMVAHRTVFADASRPRAEGVRWRLLRDAPRRMLVRQPPHVDSLVVRREVHDRVRFDESFAAAADLDYMLRLALDGPMVEVDAVLAMHRPAETGPSAIALDRRIAARRQFRAKHDALFDRTAQAFYDLRLGHLYQRAGNRRHAIASFVRSLGRRPTSGLAWRGLAAACLPRSVVERRSKV